jgi:hypothetical protein
MPPHADKTRHDLEFLQQQLGESKNTIPALKAVLFGAVLTLRQSVQLLADEAGGSVAGPNRESAESKNSTWPEFALYDCAMCHHDLRYPAWRQNHTQSGSPGRPQIPRWPQALVGVAIEQAAGPDQAAADKMKHEFATLLSDLDAPFLKQPFGDRATIAEPATKLIAFLDDLQVRLKQLPLDRNTARLALQQLCAAALEKLVDYDSARQIALAMQSTFDGLYVGSGTTLDDKKIEEQLQSLNTELHLTLHPLNGDVKDACAQSISDADLQSAMQQAAAYSPEQFQERVRNIQSALDDIHRN